MNIKNYRNKYCFVIPTFTNTKGLINLLDSLNNFYPEYPAVIINNNKALNLEKIIPFKKLQNKIIILNQSKNTGFAKACNDGARRASKIFKPDYLVFLNDDISFDSDWVGKCLVTILKNKWIAISPLLIKKDNSIENCGYKILPIGKVRLITDLKSNETPDGLSATALIFKTEVFFKLKGFDERFFAYLEDVDLFLRAKTQGYKFGVCKETKVKHLGQETSSKMNVKKAYLDFKNWILIISKNWSREEIRKNMSGILIERMRNLWGIIKTVMK